MTKAWVALAVTLCAAAPTTIEAQVFLASEPSPRFLIGPLFVVANVSPGLGPVTVNLSWSLTARPGQGSADIAQDLYLLWPAEIAERTAPGPADPELVRDIEGRGFAVASSGRLMLRTRDRMQVGTAALGDPIDVTASYVSFARTGSQSGAVTFIKIPWTPRLVDPLSLVALGMPLRGLIVPKAATWIDELFWGRRYVLTTGFGDLGPPALGLFALYYEHRHRIVHLAREYSLVIANFGDSDHLKLEEISPATAVRRQSRVRAGGEVVALALLPAEDITAQSLRVQFQYFGGRINWRPVIVSVILILVTNFAGVLILSKDVSRRIRRRLAPAPGPQNGAMPARDAVGALIPAGTSYDDVVARLGRPDEERERVTPPGLRTMIYCGANGNGAGQYEVAVELHDDRVREVTCVTTR